ncbi:cupin domain-containing protein [Algoriphagus limi]|uniref:Cupin domain-containing protein n=1 Tax=Algoriphagus limi TaxID=2975273 RepID=A0ABT2G224_9BACT|nr:cupin domain-containing protein [Algoriphagus limi]MCS5489296.1 cupin domain-containing protein [Algoriphagus limi]
MKTTKTLFHLFLGLCFFLGTYSLHAQTSSIEESLQNFVESYKTDPMALSTTFGIKVGDEWWTVSVRRFQEPYLVGKNKQYTFHNFGPHEVTLSKGQPSIPTWYFRFVDQSVLEKIERMEWTATTAVAKSTPADVTALDILDMDGYQSSQGATAIAYQTLEHFWKTNPGEVTRFSRDSSLPSHGAQLVALYTMKDKRISWFTLGTDEVANGDRGLDKGQVPNLFIITKGKGKAQIGEEEIDLEPGMSVFVGPYVSHVLYNPYQEPLEGILILYGDNIDYALGQSYLDFLDQEYAFYEKNEQAVKSLSQNK